ncbi:MAG TPA: hypothetical protein VKE74_10985 [Gemmataceae bacterium]|nr:hypothetical protein [Gemmataceae bacterium]
MTRPLFTALLFALAPLPATADEPKKPDYFPLAKGHKWEYIAEVGDTKEDFIITVTAVKTENGKTTATRRINDMGREREEDVTVGPDGVLGNLLPGLMADRRITLLKYPVKPRDTWTEKFQIKDQDIIALSSVKEAEEVKVPAGTFQAVAVETGVLAGEGKDSLGITTWYANGTGMVKMKLVAGEKAVTVQLKKFTPGK